MRLDKFLSNMGKGTRIEVKSIIKQGYVSVNGITQKNPQYKVHPEKDNIMLDNEKIEYKKFIYLMLNKPQGYISATYDSRNPVVTDLVPAEFSHYDLFPVGRLDIDTEGLLILTNDGKLAHNLLSPKNRIPKTYFAEVDKTLSPQDVEIFKKGITLDEDFTTLPAQLNIITSEEPSSAEVTIYEGKFHQVKRMFEAVGKKVTYLKRISMNLLTLDNNLKLGEIRELTETEFQKLTTKH